jgi:dTDP-4-dehydrorhamnose reductase
MRILVTGISGQVGGALLSRLSGHEVIACDRRRLDLSRPDRIAEALDALSPELIVNPAAYTAVDKAEDEADLANLVNAKAPAALAKWGAAAGVPLVHFSTDYVFDGSGDRPWQEDSPTKPLSVYGASKLAGEQAVRAAFGGNLVVRTSWVYAAKGSNFLRTIARLARERKELRIVADQVGAPTSAAVIAHAVVAIIGSGSDLAARAATAHGIVHLTASGTTSWHGFASAIVKGLQIRGVTLAVEHIHPIRSEEYPTKAVRPRNSRLDLSRLEDVFGVVPPSWNEALEMELDQLTRSGLVR